MKKGTIISLACLPLLLSACGSTSGASSSESAVVSETKTEAESVIGQAQTIGGITISADSFCIEPYSDVNNEYTKRIAMDFTIKNDTDSAFGYTTSWSGKLQDGYKLHGWSDIADMGLKQVSSHSEVTDTAYFLIDDSISLEEIIVTYNFMDYNEEYWADFGKIMSGEMGESEWSEKYGGYKTLDFTVRIEE